MERQIASLGAAVNEVVTKIREQIAVLEEEKRRFEERTLRKTLRHVGAVESTVDKHTAQEEKRPT